MNFKMGVIKTKVPINSIKTLLTKRLQPIQLSFICEVTTSSSATSKPTLASEEKTDDEAQVQEFISQKSFMDSKTFRKLPARPPFMKNFFLGLFDKQWLTYPETVDKENYDFLEKISLSINNYFQKVDSIKIDSEAKICPEVLNDLKQLGLYGLQVPAEFGGLNLNATEYARLMEIISLDGSIYATLSAHQSLGLKGVMLKGTKEQKQKYLPLLASGEWTSAFCLAEPEWGKSMTGINTVAKLSLDGSHYILNGTKTWVTNGENADLMVVAARIEPPARRSGELTVFLVEKNFGGISTQKIGDRMGLRGSNIAQVNFMRTHIPVANVLGEKTTNSEVIEDILNFSRFTTGIAGIGMLKRLMQLGVSHAVNRKQFGNTLSNFGLIKEKLANMAVDTYAIESMTYFVAGLIDKYDNQDFTHEAAALKIFSSEKLWEHTSECLQIFGASGFLKDTQIERMLRDCRSHLIHDTSNEVLHLKIGHTGVRHALDMALTERRSQLAVTVTKWLSSLNKNSAPVLHLELSDNIHPTLMSSTNLIEVSLQKLLQCVENLYDTEEDNVFGVDKQLVVRHLSQMAIDLFAMSAVVSRASRSYCIGLHNSDHEIELALTFVITTMDHFNKLHEKLEPSVHKVKEEYANRITESLVKKDGYGALDPLIHPHWCVEE